MNIFSKKEFLKCIGWIVLSVGYSNNGFSLWVEPQKSTRKKLKGKTSKEIGGKTYLLKVSGNIYSFNCLLFHNQPNMLSNTNLSISCVFILGVHFPYLLFETRLKKFKNLCLYYFLSQPYKQT